jgi:hypothetical protein
MHFTVIAAFMEKLAGFDVSTTKRIEGLSLSLMSEGKV